MPRIHAAIIREPGESIVLVSVKRQVLESSDARKSALRAAESLFGMPAVLVAQDINKATQVWGHRDHLRFLSGYDLDTLSWKHYEFGDTESPAGSTVCPACDGTGQKTCPACDGRGFRRYRGSRPGERERDDVCFGTGYVTCRICKGTGYL